MTVEVTQTRASRVAGPGAVVLHGDFSHDDGDELAIVLNGSAVVGADVDDPTSPGGVVEETYELNRHIALWIPAGVRHSVRLRSSSLICPMRFDHPRAPEPTTDAEWRLVTEIRVTPELRRLALAEVQTSLVRFRSDELVKAAVLDLLPGLESNGLLLRMPLHPQASRVARDLRRDPGSPLSLQEWAEQLYVSTKTLQRAFVAQTGLTFSQWRTRCRMRSALSMLCHGLPIEEVRHRVGYDGVSGFTIAFRRETGMDPREVAF